MPTNDDWLSIEPKVPARELMKRDPEFAALVVHNKKLSAMQRNFITCYAGAHYDPVLACQRYKEKFGRSLTPRKLNQWMQGDPEFLKAIQLREEIAARAAGVSAANVLDCLADIRRRNLGKDDRAAMQALEMIGKHLNMFKRDESAAPAHREGPALLIQINATQAPTVQATTDNRVIIDVPRPER